MTQSVLLARIEYLQAELAALAALVRLGDLSAARPAPAAPAEPRFEIEAEPAPSRGVVMAVGLADELPPEPEPEPEGGDLSIDPAQAAEILGVARQTVDRRLKDGVKRGTPGAPKNVSKGAARARWRWTSEDAVQRWWAAVR